MNSMRWSIYSNSRRVLQQPKVSLVVKFETRCQYHHIKLHQSQLNNLYLNKNHTRSSFTILSSRFISSKNITTDLDSVESQNEQVTKLFSNNTDRLAEIDNIVPADKSNISSPELTELSSIPEAPISKLAELLQELAKEPPIEDLGLGGWTPAGMVQQCLEYLHIGIDMPWWQCIMLATAIVRLCLFPITVLSQRSSVNLHNHMPEMQRLQLKMSEARQSGDDFEAARAGQELMIFFKEKKVNPLKSMAIPLIQAPIFISFFMGLRGMANVPVDSMKEGGILWFVDLTLPDQFYILPVITCVTLLATLELGSQGASIGAGGNTATAKYAKYIIRAVPLVIFPFTLNFPGAMLLYWCTTNFISLVQVAILRVPSVRTACKIPARMVHDPAQSPIKRKGFVKDMKESLENSKITKELAERKHLDEMQFNKAGRAALVKTYKFNPTLQRAKSTDTKSSSISSSSSSDKEK